MVLTCSSIARPDLLRREDHRLGQAGRHLSPTDLGPHLAGVGHGRADGQLDVLAGALADGDAVLGPHVALDGGVDVEAAATDGPDGHQATERDDRRLGGPSTHVDHHVPHRLMNVESGAHGRSHRLLDEVGGRSPGPPGRLLHGAPLDGGDGRGHADQDPRPVELRDTGPPEQQADHPLGDVEVGDGPLAQRAHGDDVARRSADHLPRLVPHGQYLMRAGVECDDGRLVQDDAPTLGVDEGIGRSQIDSEVPSHGDIVGLPPGYGGPRHPAGPAEMGAKCLSILGRRPQPCRRR